jgi:hypothetical protein
MPFVGNSANMGTEQVGAAQTSRNQSFVAVADNSVNATNPLNVTAMARVTAVVTQIAGAPGFFQVRFRTQGNAPNLDLPPVPIAALNVPVYVTYPLAARSALIRCTAPPAGGPHTFQTTLMAASA